MQLLKIALSVTVISVLLQGCATNFRVNLSSRDTDIAPLPMISAPINFGNGIFVNIKTVDKKPAPGAWYIYVDEGSHEVVYSCGREITGIEGPPVKVTIPVQPGMSYLLKGELVTETNTTNTMERVGTQTHVGRDASGRLIQSHEPVYSNVPRSSTKTVGCEAKILTCKGYPYINRFKKVSCFDEPMGKLKAIGNELERLF